jgi:hypothetical protein
MMTDISTIYSALGIQTLIFVLYFKMLTTNLERGVRLLMQTSAMVEVEGYLRTLNGSTEQTVQYRRSGTMSNICMLSTSELQQAIEVIQELVATDNPSEYLREEAQETIDMLTAVDTITVEAYLLLNKLKES